MLGIGSNRARRTSSLSPVQCHRMLLSPKPTCQPIAYLVQPCCIPEEGEDPVKSCDPYGLKYSRVSIGNHTKKKTMLQNTTKGLMYPETPKTCLGKVARPSDLDWFWNRTTLLDYDENETAGGIFLPIISTQISPSVVRIDGLAKVVLFLEGNAFSPMNHQCMQKRQ